MFAREGKGGDEKSARTSPGLVQVYVGRWRCIKSVFRVRGAGHRAWVEWCRIRV